MTQDNQMWRSTGIPRKRARRSFSRIASNVRPNGERNSAAIMATAIAKQTSTK
jgi:hypothetical protein